MANDKNFSVKNGLDVGLDLTANNITANTISGSLDWSYVANKPDPRITVTLSGDVSGAANTTLTDLANGSISITTTVADDSHNHIIANVDGLQTALDGKAPTSHGHVISDVTGLQTALDGKAATSHGHIISDVTGLQTALDGKVDDTVYVIGNSGLTGGGALTANLTISHADTSTQASVNNAGTNVIQSVILDEYGHVTGLSSASINTYSGWTLHTDSVSRGLITEGEVVNFVGGTNVSLAYSVTNNTITINSTDTNTDTNTTYAISAVDSGANAIIRLTAGGSGSGTDDITLVAGSNITLTPVGDNITIAATDTNTTYANGAGLGLTGTTFSHLDTSSVANLTASGRRYVTGLTFDGFGHVTGVSTGTETVVDTNTTYDLMSPGSGILRLSDSANANDDITFIGSGATSVSSNATHIIVSSTDTNTLPNNATITLNPGAGLTGGGAFTTDQASNQTIVISHADTSTQGSINNSNGTVIQDITLDTYGHITSIGSANLDSRYVNTSGGTMTGFLTLSADPTSALHAATKEYVDTLAAASLHYHDPVRVESPVNLSATYNNGSSGVGATLTGANEVLVIDGVTLSLNDRVLLYVQTNAVQNGVYYVSQLGVAGTTPWILTRSTDADSYSPSDPLSFGQGDAFFVQQGSTGAGELYVMTTPGVITFGTTQITFSQVSSTQIYTADGGLELNGTVFSHTDTSTQSSVNNSGTTVIQDVTLDTYGHVIGLGSTTLSIPTVFNSTITIAAGGGLTTGGDFTTNQSSNETITIAHADTSTQASLTALTGAAVVSDIDVDGFGHVTNLATRNITLANLGYSGATNADNYGGWNLFTDSVSRGQISSNENVNIVGGTNVSLSYSATNNTITINSTDTNTDTNTTYSISAVDSGANAIIRLTAGGSGSGTDDVTLVAGSNITLTPSGDNITIAATDTNTTYSAGTLLGLSGTTFNVNLSELTTSIIDGDGDFFVVVDAVNAQRKLTKANINISGFNNDAGYTTNIGDITGVTAGTGLTGGGVSGSVTLSHADTSSVANLTASGRRYVTGLTFDGFGHVTGVSTGTETVVNTDTNTTYDLVSPGTTGVLRLSDSANANDDITFIGSGATTISSNTTHIIVSSTDTNTTYSAGAGIGLVGTTFSHADTSTQVSLTALTGAAVVSDIDVDGFGHVTNISTRNLTLANLGYTGVTNADNYGGWNLFTDGTTRGSISSGENVNIVGGTNVSLSYSATNNTITINSTDTNTDTNTTYSISAVDSGANAIIRLTAGGSGSGTDDITLVAGSNITLTPVGDNITIAATDTNTTYSAGNGIALTGTTFSVAAGTGLAQNASGLSVAANGIGATQLNVSGNGTAGQALLSDGDGSFSWGAAGSSVTVSTTAPLSPSEGELWWDEDTGNLFIYYTDIDTSQWVEASPNPNPFTYNAGTSTYTITGNLTVTGDLNSNSDETLKENINTFEGGMEAVNSMRGVRYNWKENGKSSIGLIAQEVEQILPELVSDQDGIKSVQYGNIVAVLIEAVKELSARIEELENK